MTLRRGLTWFFAVFGVLLLACVLYLALADLGRHKGRIESLVTRFTGREFTIAGELRLELFPTISLVAENVRLANAGWASKQPMVQAGRLVAEVGFWSLVSGPVHIRTFELRDATLLLERGREDRVNWNFRESAEPVPARSEADSAPLPWVIAQARLREVRLIYRARGKRDRIVRFDNLSIAPGHGNLLALEGRGGLNEYPITLDGEIGPLEGLLKGREVRVDMKASVGRLALDIQGGVGQLHPLEGADLRIRARGEDVDAMLARLELPLVATGALNIEATILDAGKLTRLDLNATAGDLNATVNGTVAGLQLRGAKLTFEAGAADAARLAGVFGITGVPAAALSIRGQVEPRRDEIRIEDLRAQLSGVTARLQGTLQQGRESGADLHFEFAVEDLSALRADLPAVKLSAAGDFAANRERLEISDLTAAVDENTFAGRMMTTRGKPRRLEVDLSSPHIDLTKYFPSEEAPPDGEKPAPEAKKATGKSRPDGPEKQFFFSEEPLPLLQLGDMQARLHLAVAELSLANKSLKDIDATADIDPARVTLSARARGSVEGAIEGSITVEPHEQSASVGLRFALENVRAGFDMKDMQPGDVPPLNADVDITAAGGSARQLAASANGRVLLTQGPGKTRSEFLDVLGGDVLAQLRTKLNPFRAQDPFTHLDCSVLRADIVDGQVAVESALLQTRKVTAVAKGNIDLHTEKLTFDFDTRPRKGIGVSPGMFTNPFIRLEGTLSNPHLAMGAKGVGSGAVAAATGGLSVLASGFVDRLKGEADLCSKALPGGRP